MEIAQPPMIFGIDVLCHRFNHSTVKVRAYDSNRSMS